MQIGAWGFNKIKTAVVTNFFCVTAFIKVSAYYIALFVFVLRECKLNKAFGNIIVGFPGETEDDFDSTCDFVKKIGFSKIHVFPYSPRKNTRASNFTNKIDARTKRMRTSRLIALSKDLAKQYKKNFFGKTLPVLFEEKTNSGYLGYTDNYIKVCVKSDFDLVNKILDTKIVDTDKEIAEGILQD